MDPREKLANVGDLVDLDSIDRSRLNTKSLPGLVLDIDDGWAHVEWYDTSKTAKTFKENKWSQWHPRPKLTVISRG